MLPWNIKDAVMVLGEEFERREMRAHLAELGKFWRNHVIRYDPPGEWGYGMVIEWLCLLRISPFTHHYQVLPRHAPCPDCSAAGRHGAPHSFTRASWPGGCLEECRDCGRRWLVE